MLTKTYTIACDGAEGEACTTKPITYTCGPNPVDGPGQVRRLANEAGWRRFSGGTDACPLHVAAHHEAGKVQLRGKLDATPQPAGYRGQPITGVTVDEAAEGMRRTWEALRKGGLL